MVSLVSKLMACTIFGGFKSCYPGTGRTIHDDKVSYISGTLPPVLERLGLSKSDWLDNSQHFETRFRREFARKQPPAQAG